MITGHDFLGLGSKYWPIEEAVAFFKALNFRAALGVFAREFGDALPKVRTLLLTGKVSAVRVHLWFDHDHEIVPMDYLEKEAPRWEALAKEFPDIPFYVSHSCEYKPSPKKEIKKRVDAVVRLCPSCIPVQSPMNAYVVPGYTVEKHGSKAKAKPGDIVSSDGNELSQMDVQAWLKKNGKAAIIFGWACRYNLIDGKMIKDAKENHLPLPDPKKRKSYPSVPYCKGIEWMLWATVPNTNNVNPLKKPDLYKVFSEDFPNDPRASKPCIMIKGKAKSVKILNIKEELLCEFPLYKDPNPHKLERYYSGSPGGPKLWGWEIAKAALQSAGSDEVYIEHKGKKHGPFNPACRYPWAAQ